MYTFELTNVYSNITHELKKTGCLVMERKTNTKKHYNEYLDKNYHQWYRTDQK